MPPLIFLFGPTYTLQLSSIRDNGPCFLSYAPHPVQEEEKDKTKRKGRREGHARKRKKEDMLTYLPAYRVLVCQEH
jgi:hypothetical protein